MINNDKLHWSRTIHIVQKDNYESTQKKPVHSRVQTTKAYAKSHGPAKECVESIRAIHEQWYLLNAEVQCKQEHGATSSKLDRRNWLELCSFANIL